MLPVVSIQNRERPDRPRADPGTAPAAHSAQWLLHMLTGALDELDYGLLILDTTGHLMQANQMGHHHCTAAHGSCLLQGQQLHTRCSTEDAVLQRALALAAAGRRSLVKLGVPSAHGLERNFELP